MQQENSKNSIRIAVSIISILLLLFSVIFVYFKKEELPLKPKIEAIESLKEIAPVIAKVEPEIIKPVPVVAKEESPIVKDLTPNTVKVEVPIVVKETPLVVKEPEPEIVIEKPIVVVEATPAVVTIVEPEEVKPVPVVIKEEPKVEVQPKLEVVKVPEVVAPVKEEVVEEKKALPPVLSHEYLAKFCFNGETHIQKAHSAITFKTKSMNEKVEFKEFLGLINIEDNKNFSLNLKSFASLEFKNEINKNHIEKLCNCEFHRHRLSFIDEFALVNFCVVSYTHRHELLLKEKIRFLKNTRLVLLGLKYINVDESLQKWLSEINLEIISSQIEKL